MVGKPDAPESFEAKREALVDVAALRKLATGLEKGCIDMKKKNRVAEFIASTKTSGHIAKHMQVWVVIGILVVIGIAVVRIFV